MVFEQEYNNIKNSITYSNDGMCLLDKETVKLLALLCTDGNGKHQKVLIPNLSGGELALCADEWEGYTLLEKVRQVLQDKILNTNNQLILEDFLKADIETKYKSIILFPPMGVRIGLKRIEEAYIDKCLNLLDEGGRLIVLVPQNVTNSMAFTDLRERILRGYSLEAVIMVKRKETAMNTNIGLCALVIEAKNQTQNIYMSLGGQDADDIFRGFKQGTDGFYVDASEVYDRFDVSFYEPQYKEVRNLIQKRDTVKLGDLAIVFPGIMIPSEERKAFGDYLIIKPQNICDREVHLDNQKKVYCLKEFINSGRRATNCVLRNGDILVSIAGKIDWAIYTGADNVAVAHQSVAVIRGIEGKEDWLRLFFSTNTGIEHFESQLKFFSHCGVVNHISIGELSAIAVPDTKLMTMADNVRKGIDIEAKVSALFRDLGWDVREEYRKDGFAYDLSLFYNNELRGVVEVKTYESQKIRNNRMIARQLEQYKRNLNNVGLYLFIDNEIYEYNEGKLEQLAELPRPEKTEPFIKQVVSEGWNNGEVLQIKKNTIEEKSLIDSMFLEFVTRGEEIISRLNRIEGKIDNIAEKIEMLFNQISGYQSLVDKQLKLAISPEEEEHIIHAFSEECAERIVCEMNTKSTNQEYNTELHKLVLLFGDDAWKKMDESSHTFLVSARVIFNNLLSLQDIVDYSGVCVLVTKALEVELGKRFCKNFLTYLKQNYPGKVNYPNFPTGLLNRYGKPITPTHFTLGSVAYVLCYKHADDLTKEQKENDKEKLLEYTREKLFSGKTDNDIMTLLDDYAELIEKVKEEYRNPSAHTNEIKRVDAEQCFALVVDVEKLMKRMLDSFDE